MTIPDIYFIVVAPPFSEKSAGVVVLHRLYDSLLALGYSAYLVIFANNTDGIHYYAMQSFERNLSREVVIYPEVLGGNPLNSRYVVRYFLNYEGKASGNFVSPGKDDFIIAYWPEYVNPHHAQIAYLVDAPPADFQGLTPAMQRVMDATYIGKGRLYGECTVIGGSVEITRSWPETKNALYELLRQVRFLYNWDSISSIGLDALVCGCIPVVMQESPISIADLRNIGCGANPVAWLQQRSDHWVVATSEHYENDRKALLERMRQINLEHPKRLHAIVDQLMHHFNLIG